VKKAAIALLVLAALISTGGGTLSAAQGQKVASFALIYDLDSVTTVYPRMLGQGGDPWGAPMPGSGRIKTVGSTTTVTEAVAGELPFTNLAVGDVLFVRYEGINYLRAIAAKASGASITVDSAIDLSNNATFSWMKLEVGAAATNGWIELTDLSDKTLSVQYNIGDLTGGLDVIWECRTAGPNSAPIQVYPPTGVMTLAAPGSAIGTGLVVYEQWSACRIGLKANTADPGDPTAESITAHIVGR